MFNININDTRKIEMLFLLLIFLVVFGMFLAGEVNNSAEAVSVTESIVVNLP
ncbi:hypothetical protein [Persephonella sp.]